MEQGPSRVEVKPLIDQSQVLGEFRSFQVRAQEGFKTHVQSLRSYGSLMYSLDRYFNQDEVADLPETIDLVKKLFYQHDTVAPFPVEFFIETRNRLEKEVLGVYQQPGERFKEELDFIKGSVRHELQRVTYDFQLEEQDRLKLEQLANRSKDQVLAVNITEDLETKRETREGRLREAAIEVLSKDPQTSGKIKRRDDFEKRLSLLIKSSTGGYSEETIRGSFVGMEDLLVRENSIAVMDEVSARLRRGQTGEVTRVLTQILKDSQGIDAWTRLISHGLIPEEVTDGFQDVVVLSELQDTVNAVSSLPKEARAFFLLPFLEKGISSSLLYEIVEGRFDLDVDLISKQFDAFTHFIDIYKEESIKKGLTLRQKLILASLASMVATSALLLFNAENGQPKDQVNQILDTIPKSDIDALQSLKSLGFSLSELGLDGADAGDLSPDDLTDSDSMNLPLEPNPAPESSLPSDKGKGSPGADANSSASSQNNFSETPPQGSDKPKNDSPESMEESMKKVEWNLQGKDLRRFYQTNTAANFDSRNKTWVFKNDFKEDKNQHNQGSSSITLSEDTVAHDQWIKLPVPPDYRFTVVYTFAGISSGKPDIYVSSDGDYMLKLPKDAVGKRIQFAYGVSEKTPSVKAEVQRVTKQEILSSLKRLANIEDLPENTQKFITDLNSKPNLSTGVKAKVLEQYVQNNFLYSLDTKWSDYYQEGKGSREFIKRIFEIRKTDCDVANTALISLLRMQGIPARLALGYAHHNPTFNPNETTLAESEGHGLTQIYINGKWEYLDATPSKMDEFTQKALAGFGDLDNKRTPVIGKKGSSDEWDGTWHGFWGDITTGVNDFFAKTALIYLLNTAAWLGVDKLRRRNNAIAQKLSEEIDQRGISYFGDSFIESRLKALNWVRERELYDRSHKERSTRVLLAIPAAAFIDAYIKIKDTLKLRALPFNDGTFLPETSSKPDTFDFLTSVLGYEKDNITRRMLNSAYRESTAQIGNQMGDTMGVLQAGLLNGWQFSEHMGKAFRGMRIPTNEVDWEKSKKLTADRLYVQYTARYKKSTRDYEVYHPEVVQAPMLSRDKFQSGLDELFGYKLILWQLQEARREAMEGLDLGFRDRVLEKMGKGESKIF